MENHYKNAKKRGSVFRRQALTAGLNPNLPVLEEILPDLQSGGKDLGLIEIPAELIVGTVTAARAGMFAGNFMPAAEEGTEFSYKWKRLCEAHLAEGIREPVRAVEYMNRYYIQEGNKRVSVLKYFDAAAISGNVRRVLPERNGEEAVERYYEFVEFYKYSGINFLEFTRPGAYAMLQNAAGKEKNAPWTEDEVRKLQSVYYNFRKAFRACGGSGVLSAAGDAFLSYIRIYGYTSLWGMSENAMRTSIAKAWKEITLRQEDRQAAIRTEPEAPAASILQKVIGTPVKKAAFLYEGEPEAGSWSYYHELGRRHAENVFAGRIVTKPYVLGKEENIGALMEEMIGGGADVIFVTFPKMYPEILRAAIEHPKVDILSCSLNEPYRSVRTYYPRMYEGKFVAGAVAGALSKGHDLGYICKYPIYGAIAEINAFARGARLTDPEAVVHLAWSSVGGMRKAEEGLREKGVRLVSFREFSRQEGRYRYLFGLKDMENENLSPLLLPIWNWGIYYERILRAILNGTYRTKEDLQGPPLSYYWGMSAGVVDLLYSERLPESVRYLGKVLCAAIRDGSCKPFYQGEGSREAVAREFPGRSLEPEEIIAMNYLEPNVDGVIPAYEELDRKAKDMADHQGGGGLKNGAAAL